MSGAAIAVPDAKIVEYLLNVDHPRGGPKARFFQAFGFERDRPLVFARALVALTQAAGGTISQTAAGDRRRMIVEGPIEAPDGRRPRVRVVRQDGGDVWRLITAVPLTR